MRILDPIDRLGRRHRLLWAVLAGLCVVGLFAARFAQDRAYEAEIDAVTEVAQVTTQDVVGSRVMRDGATLRLNPKVLAIALQAELFTDPRAGSLRVTRSDGVVEYASDVRVPPAGLPADGADAGLDAALGGEVTVTEVRAPFTRATTGQRGPVTDLVRVWVPLRLADQVRSAGAVRVDFVGAELRAAAAGPWPTVQLLLAMALLAFLGLAVVGWVPDATMASSTPSAGPVAADAAGAAGASEDELAELQGRLAATETALAEAEADRVLLEASSRSEEAFVERIAELEAKLAEAELAAAEARRSLDATQSVPVGEPDTADADSGEEDLAAAQVDRMLRSEPGKTPAMLLQELARRVEAAEEATRVVEEELAGAGGEEGADLRARLARAAARKKLGGEPQR